MAKSETLSTAAKAEDLDKAYASATKALSTLGIKMTTKKPDAAKLGPAMAKNKKKAEFKLTGDGKSLKVTVECDGTVNTLGLLDLFVEKDAEKKAAIMKSLLECGLVTKQEFEAAQAAASPGKDPKVAANEKRAAEKKVEDAKKVLKLYEGLKTFDAAAKVAPFMKDLEKFAKDRHTDENLLFLKAVAAKMKKEQIIAIFIADSGQKQLNLPGALKSAIESGAKDPSEAVTEVKAAIQDNEMSELLKVKIAETKKIIDEAEKGLKKLAA